MNTLASCMTISLLRFNEPKMKAALSKLSANEKAIHWLVGADDLSNDGNLSGGSRVCCVIGLFEDSESADEVLDSPDQFMGMLDETAEACHLKLTPYAHRGENNWLQRDDPGPIFNIQKPDTGNLGKRQGPIAVMTTGGFQPGPGFSQERITRFIVNTQKIRQAMGSSADLIFQAVFTPTDLLEDGPTFSLWHSEEAMQAFAYQPGAHKERIDRHVEEPFFDRTSFTRLTVDRSVGPWQSWGLS